MSEWYFNYDIILIKVGPRIFVEKNMAKIVGYFFAKIPVGYFSNFRRKS